MKISVKKLKNGFSIPVLGLGTWQIGGMVTADKTHDKEEILAIQKAIESGLTRIDTAESYGVGHTEELIGFAIKCFPRTNLFLTSKVYKTNLKYHQVIRSLQQSLNRLHTKYLDLYLIHAPNPEIPMSETFRALDELVKAGLVKNVGVSNFSKERLQEAQRLTKNKIVLNQVHYNLIYRAPETTELLKYCQNNDVFLEAFQPTEKGELTQKGKYPELDKIATKYAKSHTQVALNWLISQTNVITIIKTTNLSHLNEDLGALGWHLITADIEFLRKNFPQQPDSQFSLR